MRDRQPGSRACLAERARFCRCRGEGRERKTEDEHEQDASHTASINPGAKRWQVSRSSAPLARNIASVRSAAVCARVA